MSSPISRASIRSVRIRMALTSSSGAQRLLAAEQQELKGHLGGAHPRLLDLLQIGASGLPRAEILDEHLGQAQDDGQGRC